jgi:glutamate--cysteine ligase
VKLRQWATELVEDMQAVAEILDGGEPEKVYSDSLKPVVDAIDDPENTPSARVLAEMLDNQESFQAYALRISQQHADYFRARSLAGETAVAFRIEALESLLAQKRTEASDKLTFEEFLGQYFSQVE